MTVSHRKRKYTADKLLENGGIRYHCDGCKRDITSTVRVRCGQCQDYDLCVDCFSRGHESQQHLNSHPYRLLDKYSDPLIVADFGADEELLLVDAIEMYGLGNWSDIADHVGTKTLEQCRDHYIEHYVKSRQYPQPNMAHQLDREEVERVRRERQLQATLEAQQASKDVIPPLKPKVAPSVPANHEIQGYMPGRGEFDTEIEQDAEHLVKDMQFNDDDTAVEVDLKLAVLDVYNSKVNKRVERKDFIHSRGLLNFKQVQQQEKRRTRVEKEVAGRTKSFATLMNDQDYKALTGGLVAEQSLRERIAQLQQYRKLGIRTFADGEEHEHQLKSRHAQVYSKSPFTATSERVTARQSRMAQSMSQDLNLAADDQRNRDVTTPDVIIPLAELSQISDSSMTFDCSMYEGYELLDQQERELCNQLTMLPRVYIKHKHALVRESERGIDKLAAREMLKIDHVKCDKIYEFVRGKGWINNVPVGH